MAKKTAAAPTKRFRTTILQAGKTATGIAVPPEIVEALGAGKRPPVQVTLKGHTYRSTIAVMGGRFMVGVSADVREAAGVAGGDSVDVAIALDAAPRDVTIPPELARVLKAQPALKTRFDGLSVSRRKLLTVPIERGKTPETRGRNLAKAVAALRAKA